MSQINDGGPAFPLASTEHIDGAHYGYAGMTLRDYFAAHAICPQGVIDTRLHYDGAGGISPRGDVEAISTAAAAYAIADAMLAARQVQP